MTLDNNRSGMNAPRLVATTFGIFAGIGGFIHGIGEVLQGNHPTGGLGFPSWTTGPIATSMAGDPAISLIPNLLVTGLITLIVSAVTILWAIAFVQRKNGGLILLTLSVIMLLVGGGVGAPVIGILAGIAGILITAPLNWWREHLSGGVRHFLAVLWPWTFAAAFVCGLFLFVIAMILISIVEITNSDLFLYSFYLTALFLLITIFTTIGYKLEHEA